MQLKKVQWSVETCFVVKFRAAVPGARDLHAPHPDGRPKAGKTSGQHEANEVSEVLVASDLWFQPSKTSLSC